MVRLNKVNGALALSAALFAVLISGCGLKKAQEDSEAAQRSFILTLLWQQTTCTTALESPASITSAASAQVGIGSVCYFKYTGSGSRTFRITAGALPISSKLALWISNDGVTPTTAAPTTCAATAPSGWASCISTPTSGSTLTVTSSRTLAVAGQGSSGNSFTLSVE